MKILKRNGEYQEFDMEKIKKGITNASIDSDTTLNNSDVKYISKEIDSIIKRIGRENNYTSTYEVSMIIFHTLIKFGFSEVATCYLDFGVNNDLNK